MEQNAQQEVTPKQSSSTSGEHEVLRTKHVVDRLLKKWKELAGAVVKREQDVSRSIKGAIRSALATDEEQAEPAKGRIPALRRRLAQHVLAQLDASPAAPAESPDVDTLERKSAASNLSSVSPINGHGAEHANAPTKLS